METPETAKAIEALLLGARGWVSSEKICELFNLANDRPLRAHGDRPGLCSDFAISGKRGFKHVAHATTAEFDHATGRMRRHALSEFSRVRRLRARRTAALQKFDPATGQGVLLEEPEPPPSS